MKPPYTREVFLFLGMSNAFFITSDHCKIHYQLEGKGTRLLLFLHGMGCSASIWNDYVKHYQHDFRILRVDFRGCGNTEHGDSKLSLFRLTEDLVELFKKLDFPQSTEITIIAHSMGAQVAFILNERRVQRIQKIIGIAAAGIESYTTQEVILLRQLMEQQRANRLPFQFSNPWLQNLQVPMAHSVMINGWLSENRSNYQSTLLEYTDAMLAEPSSAFWQNSGLPIYLIYGNNDRFIPNPLFRKMGAEAFIRSQIRELSGVNCFVIQHAGHFVLLEKLGKVLQQMDAILKN